MDEKIKDTTDQPVPGHIERLVAEEHKPYNQGAVTEEDRSTLGKNPGGARSMLGSLASAPGAT